MKSIVLWGAVLFSPSAFPADLCPLKKAEQIAVRSALAIEAINGGRPLTFEAHSMSRRIDTFGVILSYSGIQRIYLVTVDAKTCAATRIERTGH